MARITMRKTQETKLSEIFTLYLASAAARGVKDKTLRTYEQHFKAISKRLDARPVQNTVPAEFLNWLEGQDLTAKEMVELLGQCSEVGYAAIMCGRIPNSQEPVVEDPVRVPTVDLGAYDALFGKGAAAS